MNIAMNDLCSLIAARCYSIATKIRLRNCVGGSQNQYLTAPFHALCINILKCSNTLKKSFVNHYISSSIDILITLTATSLREKLRTVQYLEMTLC